MKKTLALTLALIMVLCMLPSVAFAQTDTITSSIATVTLDWKTPSLIDYDVDVEIYLDGTQIAKEHARGNGTPVGIALNINDGYNYVYDKYDANKGATVTIISDIASDGLSNGSKQAKYSGNLNLWDPRETTTVKIYLKSRGSEAKPKNYDNIITNYVKRDDILNKNHGFTHKVFEWRDDINFTYYVERTPALISNTFAAKLILELYNLNGTRTSDPDDVAYGWNMHGIDNKGLSITLASDKYWFESHATTGEENQAYYVLDNLGNGDNQVRFGSSAQKDAVQPSIKNLPRYFFRAFPLEIPLTNETLCTVHQVNKATDDTTTGHGKEMRYVKVYLNGQHQADADNTIGNNANAVYFPDRGVNMKESDIVVTNTELGNRYYREIVVDEDTKTYNIHYYNYIYKLNFDGNGATPNPASMTSGEQAVPNRSYTFENLPSMEREGYTFLGWADSPEEAAARTVKYHAGESVTLNYTNGTDGQPGVTEKTIYAVWANPNPSESPNPTPTPSESPNPTPAPSESPNPTPTPSESPNPTPTPNIPWVPGHDHNHNNNGVPPIVYIPPKTGDMPFWYSIAQFLGLVK